MPRLDEGQAGITFLDDNGQVIRTVTLDGERERRQQELVFVRIWRFRARPGKADEFRAAYGPDGAWAKLFRQGAGYLGTELLVSQADPDVCVTVDRWESAEAWAAFLHTHAAAYEALDRQCESLTVSEEEVGAFNSDGV